MNSLFASYFLLIASYASAQKPNTLNKTLLLDSLKDECFYEFKIISEAPDSKTNYYFTIGRAQSGFFTSGSAKKIGINPSNITRTIYRRRKLEKSQIDSLRQFELKLSSLSNTCSKYPRQIFLISSQAENSKYIIESETAWNSIPELLLILFRVKE